MKKKIFEYSFALKESWVHLKSDRRKAILKAVKSIRYHREKLLEYIQRHPKFQFSLEPLKVDSSAPKVIKCMSEASIAARVGPMAAVAGALADLALEAMLNCDVNIAVVENGGEIAAITDRPLYIAVISLNLKLLSNIGFKVTGADCPIGIATSTGKGNHALSFGEADSVTIVADTAALADAAATSVGNTVIGTNVSLSLRKGLNKASKIPNVRGALIVRDEKVGFTGHLPEMIKIVDNNLF